MFGELLRNIVKNLGEALPDIRKQVKHKHREGFALSSAEIEPVLNPLGDEVETEMTIVVASLDFPELKENALIRVDDKWRVVVGMELDPAGASKTLRLSSALSEYQCGEVFGARMYGGAVKPIRQGCRVLAVDTGLAASLDADAPSETHEWKALIPKEDAPLGVIEVGDRISFEFNSSRIKIAVTAIEDYGEGWFITARGR